MWLELLSALAFDGMTPSSVPLYGGGGGMTPCHCMEEVVV